MVGAQDVISAHAMRLDDQDNGVPAFACEGLIFKKQDLAGKGVIAGFAVRCITPETQVLVDTGHDLPQEQQRDMESLRERLGF